MSDGKEQDPSNDMAHYLSHIKSNSNSIRDNDDDDDNDTSDTMEATRKFEDHQATALRNKCEISFRKKMELDPHNTTNTSVASSTEVSDTNQIKSLSPLNPNRHFDSTLYSTSDNRNKFQDEPPTGSDDVGKHNNDNTKDERNRKSLSLRHVRIQVALLGLAIAVVNCYAQATFCIAIVEMVLPADFVVSKNDDIGSKSVIKVVSGDNSKSNSNSTPASSSSSSSSVLSNFGNAIELVEVDPSCPVEYKYRDYYDSWRFQANSTVAQDSSINGRSIIDISNRFEWDASRQGLLLGAFAIGTAPLQVLGGRLAEIYGAKWVLFAGLIGTALTNLTIPYLAHFSFILLVINRVVMGIAQAGLEPGLMCLLAEWLTPSEVGLFISMLLFAICVGFFLGSLCSSFILALGFGWPLAYYVAGGINLAVAILWLLYASSRPRESSSISSEELEYIDHEQQEAIRKSLSTTAHKESRDNKSISEEKNNDLNIINKTVISKKQNISSDLKHRFSEQSSSGELNAAPQLSVAGSFHSEATSGAQAPWRNILTTPSVWAFIICKISIRWCADVLAIELPTYLANVLHLSIKLNGILNSVSSALFAIFSFITGYLVNELLQRQVTDDDDDNTDDLEEQNGQLKRRGRRKQMIVLIDDKLIGRVSISKTTLRKVMQSFASFGSALSVFLMTQYDCNILFSMSMLLVLSCCIVMGTGGELQIPYDMTSRYPGTLHGMACTLSVSGWLAPPLIGLILGDQPSSRYRWSLVWYLTAFINLVGGLVFLLFADASPRDFDAATGKHEHGFVEEIDKSMGRKVGSANKHERRQLPVAAAVLTAGVCCGLTSKKSKNSYSLSPSTRGTGSHNLTPTTCTPETTSNACHAPDSQLAGYYNVACKSTDTATPPLALRSLLLSNKLASQQGEVASEASLAFESARGNYAQQQLPKTTGANLKWSPLFDRKPLKCRQVEESFIKKPVGYMQNFDSMLTNDQTMIFPYRNKDAGDANGANSSLYPCDQHKMNLSKRDSTTSNSSSENGNQMQNHNQQQGSSRFWPIRSLWSQLTGSNPLSSKNRKPDEFERPIDEQLDSMDSLVPTRGGKYKMNVTSRHEQSVEGAFGRRETSKPERTPISNEKPASNRDLDSGGGQQVCGRNHNFTASRLADLAEIEAEVANSTGIAARQQHPTGGDNSESPSSKSKKTITHL